MVALQCAMATSLQGCETVEGASELSLSLEHCPSQCLDIAAGDTAQGPSYICATDTAKHFEFA